MEELKNTWNPICIIFVLTVLIYVRGQSKPNPISTNAAKQPNKRIVAWMLQNHAVLWLK